MIQILLPPASSGKLVIGIDPGTVIMGYGIILADGRKPKLLQHGVLRLDNTQEFSVRMLAIFNKVNALIAEFSPDEIAVEAPFYAKNPNVLLQLGRAQGAAIMAAAKAEIPIREYAPTKIKQSVTGNGRASKEQVCAMLEQQLGFKRESAEFDATDAVGVAFCHLLQFETSSKKKAGSWEEFAKLNQERLANKKKP